VASIVAWEFLVAQVVNPVLVPAIVQRFQLPATHPAPESHLVLCQEGFPEPHTPTEEPDVLTAIVLLARPGDGEDVGFGLFEPDAGENRYRLVKSVPLRPNSALVCLQGPGARASLSPPDGGAARELYVLEVRVTTT